MFLADTGDVLERHGPCATAAAIPMPVAIPKRFGRNTASRALTRAIWGSEFASHRDHGLALALATCSARTRSLVNRSITSCTALTE